MNSTLIYSLKLRSLVVSRYRNIRFPGQGVHEWTHGKGELWWSAVRCHWPGSEEAGVLAQEAGLGSGKVVCGGGTSVHDIPCRWEQSLLPKGSETAGTLVGRARMTCSHASRATFFCTALMALVSGLWTQKIWRVFCVSVKCGHKPAAKAVTFNL